MVTNPGARPVFEGMAAPLSDVDGLRRFYGRERFRILVASACVPEPIFHTLDRLSGLTEFLIARLSGRVEQALRMPAGARLQLKPLSDPQNQMMVVALGRLGMRELILDPMPICCSFFRIQKRFGSRFDRVAERVSEIL